MVKTHGLTHISLAVSDLDRTLRFYGEVFGPREYQRDGKSAGIAHFGFRLTDPADIETAVREVERAGGRLLQRGEFSPGFPFAYVADPDGYMIEIWYE